MRLELSCQHCTHTFYLPANSATAAVLEQVATQGPWCALGDGETLEDKVYTDLLGHASICCTKCGGPVAPREESLHWFAQEMLACW
jgi:hypothetical protein